MYSLGDGKIETVVHNKDVQKVCKEIISVMKDGLPEEAHIIEALYYVLDECKQVLRNQILALK